MEAVLDTSVIIAVAKNNEKVIEEKISEDGNFTSLQLRISN
jgi:predicted nucleic acid-binding protein